MVLKEYWPRCLQELIEFQQIANAEQPEFEKVVSDVKSAADDFFLVSLSEYGCERWEKILGLSVEPGDTLQDRRDRILIKYLDQLPYTYRTLLKYLMFFITSTSPSMEVVKSNFGLRYLHVSFSL